MLSDNGIRKAMLDGHIKIADFEEANLRPASYVLRLNNVIAIFNDQNSAVDLVDSSTYPSTSEVDISSSSYELRPGEFVLGGTIESVSLSLGVSATLRNLSGLSRLGMAVEIASFVSPGFGQFGEKPLTLEIRNFSQFPILLRPDIPICHMIFWRLDQEAEKSYDQHEGRHSMLKAPSSSRYYEHFNGSLARADRQK